MSEPGPLDILIDLAGKQSDARTRDLGQALKAETSEGKRLTMLLDYRTNYLATLARAQQRGMTSGMLINYNHFLGKLDAAIGQQEEVVRRAKGNTEVARNKLNEAERKRKSLVTISDRRAAEARVAAGRREQKQHDEISNRLATRRNSVTQPMRIASEQALRDAMTGPHSVAGPHSLPVTQPPSVKQRKA